MSDVTYTREGDRNKLAIHGDMAATVFYWRDGDPPELFEGVAREAMRSALAYARKGRDLMEQAVDAQDMALLTIAYVTELLQLAQMLREGQPITVTLEGADGA